MNLGSASVVLRPRSARESFDLAFLFLIRVGGWPYLRFGVAVLTPALAACLGLGLWLDWREAHVWLLAVPLGVWLQGLFTLATGQLMFAPALEQRSVLRSFSKRLPAYTLGLVASRGLVLVLAGTLLLAPWAWSRVMFVPEMLLLEGLSPSSAIQRSSRLGKTRGGLALALWMAGAVGYCLFAGWQLGDSIVHFTLQVPPPAATESVNLTTAYLLFGWFASLPLLATLRFFCYVDGRTRGDGWDAQVKLQRMAQASAEPA
ncbi:MAG TPA: hypothetical protein VMG12_43320 [Polyangiaceae bacterium]|nr:hypothetical protein [Polyangiaceae bacterium]